MLPFLSAALARATGREPIGVELVLRGLLTTGLGERGGHVRIGRNVTLVSPENIRLGRHVTIYGNTVLNAGGRSGFIRIGEQTHLDHFCLVSGLGGIAIGKRCAISSGVIIYSHTNEFRKEPETPILDQPVRYAAVTLGDDLLIGARAVILPGVTVGDHAVIGAGAVVHRDVPAWAIVAGTPAAVIADRRQQKPPRAKSPLGT
jgi:acetyltransferase-like isoleucine patch superfamily enzyme